MKTCTDRYDKLIRVERLAGTADAHGHIDNTADANWATHGNSYARVQSKGGREFWKVQQVNADVSHVWWVPYSSEMASATPDMRLINEGKTYEILSVIDIDLAHQQVEIQTRCVP